MGTAADPCILTKAATKLEGRDFVKGVLMVTACRLAWHPDDPSTTKPVLLERSSIQRTQRAPEKPFIKLFTASGPLILGFDSMEERNEAVDVLAAAPQQPSGSSGKVATGPDAKRKRELLEQDGDLRSLYDQLVNAGILNEAEFWQSRQHLLRTLSSSGAAKGGGGSAAASSYASSSAAETPLLRQRPGLPSAMLANVRPSADGRTETVQFKLTKPAIQQIFAEKPEAHRAFLAHVPTTMSEEEFWRKYFKLEYKKAARRQKLARDGKGGSMDDDEDEDDFIAPFLKQRLQQDRQRAKTEMSRVDPTVNLAADVHDRLGAGFGVRDRQAEGRDAGTAAGVGRAGQQGQAPSGLAALAYDINRHAAFVLGGAPEGLEDAGEDDIGEGKSAEVAAQVAAALQAAQKQREREAAAQGAGEAPEEWRLRAASALEDLRLDDEEGRHVPLNIQDPRLYFDRGGGAGPAAEGAAASADGVGQGSKAGAADVAQLLGSIDPSNLRNPPCPPALAAEVVLELSQEEDEGLVREFGPIAATAMGKAPRDVLLPQLLALLRGEALKTNELLRHFWGAVPIISAPREQKAAKICQALQEQRTTLEAHMRARPGTSEQVYITQMLRPLAVAIDAALEKQEKEMMLFAKSQKRVAGGMQSVQ